MPDVRDARVRKREKHQKHSAEVGIPHSPHSAQAARQKNKEQSAGRLGRKTRQGGFPGRHQRSDRRIHNRGSLPHARDKSHQHTRREAACESDKRDRDTLFSQRSQRNRWIKFHAVGVSHESRKTEGSRTTQWHSIPESFLGVSRPSCGKLPHWRRTSDYAVAGYCTAVLE